MATVNLTETAIKAITDAVVKQRDADMLEQYRQFARQEIELTKAREDIARKDIEIAELRSRLAQLSGLLTYAPAPAPVAVTQPAPAWPTPQPHWTAPVEAVIPVQAPAAS